MVGQGSRSPQFNAPVASTRWRLHRRSVLVGVLEFAISAALLGIIVARVDLSEINARLGQLSVISALIVAGLMLIQVPVSALRWQLLLTHLGGRASFWCLTSGVLLERFVNQALPSSAGGDGARTIEITRSGQALRGAAYSVVLDRMFGIAGLAVIVAAFLPFGPASAESNPVFWLLASMSLLPLIGLVVLLIAPRAWWEKMRDWPFFYYPIDVLLQLRDAVSTPRVLLLAAGTSILMQMMPIPCFLILASDLHIPLGTMDAIILVPVIMLTTLLPISTAGWGMREGAAILLLGQVGMNEADAVLLSVLYGLIGLATGCFGGLLWLLSHRRSRRPPLERKYPS
jgi:uncharacterized membrane protein YbhN (UPF0104 family)